MSVRFTVSHSTPRRPEGRSSPSRPACSDPLSPRGSSQRSTGSSGGFGARTHVTLEADPFPGLRIHFADFPCLHCSIDQRGCSPWRPDAVMSTARAWAALGPPDFQGPSRRTGHHAACGALPAAGPYLRLSRFRGGRAVKRKDNSSRGPRRRLGLPNVAVGRHVRFGNVNSDSLSKLRVVRCRTGFPSLRID